MNICSYCQYPGGTFLTYLCGHYTPVPTPPLKKPYRFLTASALSTSVDYAVFFTSHLLIESVVVCQVIAQASGFITNLALQRGWVFEPNRSGRATLLRLSASISLGFGVGAASVHVLSQIAFFSANKLFMKVATTLLLGVYNYLTRRWSFEQRQNAYPEPR